MFGAYEVECDGRKYYGGVTVRRHRLFSYQGQPHLFLVDTLRARQISDATARQLSAVAARPGRLIPETVMSELVELGLAELPGSAPAGATDRAADRAAASGSPAPDAPVTSIALFVAQECSMDCLYCYGGAGEYGERGKMSQSTAYQAVDWLLASSLQEPRVNITFFGGEPLLNFPLIRQVVQYAKERAHAAGKQVDFAIRLSGSIVTDEMAAFLKEERVSTQVSFEGTAELQDLNRPLANGKSSFEKVSANIQKLRVELPVLIGRGTVYGEANPAAIQQGLKEAGFDTFIMKKASPPVGNPLRDDPAYQARQKRTSDRMVSYYRQEGADLLTALQNGRMERNYVATLVLLLLTGKRREHHCAMGRFGRAVSATGELYPCHRFVGMKEFAMGQVDVPPDGAPTEYHADRVDALPSCATCWAKYLCGGGCFYMNLAKTGDLRTPDGLDCQEMYAAVEAAIYVYCQLDESQKQLVLSAYGRPIAARVD